MAIKLVINENFSNVEVFKNIKETRKFLQFKYGKRQYKIVKGGEVYIKTRNVGFIHNTKD